MNDKQRREFKHWQEVNAYPTYGTPERELVWKAALSSSSVMELVAFVTEITTAGGKYSYLDGTPIVLDAYKVLKAWRGE